MTRLVVIGGRDARGERIDLVVDAGLIVDVTLDPSYDGAQVVDATGLTVLPGLLDLQVNGAAGHDLTLSPDRLWEVAAALGQYGVTAFAPTVITSDPACREEALGVLKAGPPAEWYGAVPLGWHFEGPMLSPLRRGAHPERWLVPPDPALVAGWSRADGVLIATIAPELPGALEVIRLLHARGVVISVGHTDADAGQVAAAVAAGATCVTHLGNAMRPMLTRDPGPVGAALGGSELVAGVIVDGHHLDPLTLVAVWRALGPDRFLAVSDATAPLGRPDGPDRLGAHDVVLAEGAVRLADGTLAGSATPVSRCLALLRETTGCTLADAVVTATTTPARLVGDPTRGHLSPGARADLVLADTTDGLDVVTTLVAGRPTWGAH